MNRPLAAVLFSLALLVLPMASSVGAAEPEQPADPVVLQGGPPVAAAFLDAGHLVVATGDASGPGAGAIDCGSDEEDTDLYLVPFPNGSACLSSRDTGTTFEEGVLAMAAGGDRVVVGVPRASLSVQNVEGYQLANDRLERTFQASVTGNVEAIDASAGGERFAVIGNDGEQGRLRVLNANGNAVASHALPGPGVAVDVSPQARLVAVGGSFAEGNATYGYVQLFDLSRPASENPVLDHEVRRSEEGRVATVSVTDTGHLAAGTVGGLVYYYPDALEQELPSEHELGDDTTYVALAPNGTTLFAASGTTVAAYHRTNATLTPDWNRTLPNAAQGLQLRLPYVLLQAGDLQALDATGELLWERSGAAVLAANASGHALALVEEVPAGTTDTIQRSSVTRLVVHAAVALEQTTPAPTVAPGAAGVVNVTATNEGAALLNLSLDPEAPEGATVEVLPERALLRPGEQATFTVAATLEDDVFPGELEVPLHVRSDPAVNASVNATFRVGEATALALNLPTGALADRTAVPGQTVTFPFVLANRGNTEVQASIEVVQLPSKGEPWSYRVHPRAFLDLARESQTTFQVEIDVPEDVANGTTNRLIVQANAPDGAATAQARVTVNPFEALQLDPPTATKRMAPGATQGYTFTLTNAGTVPTNVTLTGRAIDANGTAYVPVGWTVRPDVTELSLEPGESRDVNLSISASAQSERLRAQLIARSDAGTEARALAFAVVDPALAEEPEEANRQPLGLLAPFLALAAAGLGARRRGGGGRT